MELELVKILKEINDDDLRTMFGTSVVSVIEKQDDVIEKLNKYLDYEPVQLGDIIEYFGEKFCVTCVYTDNSVDICGEDTQKRNIGLYKKDVKVIGKLEIIVEE